MPTRSTWFSFAALFCAAATMLLATVPAGAATISSPDNPRGSAMEASFPDGPFTPAVMPHAVNGNAITTVVLKMSGDPVAQVEKKSRTKLDDGQREQVRGELKGRQDAIDGDIQANGGKVVAKFQDAYNGIKVQAPANSLPALASLRNVVAVRPVSVHWVEDTQSVPFISAPAAWTGLEGVHGEGVKIGIIDTGIDYTHKNFGGPGTVDAFNAALAAKKANHLPDATWYGANSSKVKGGIDLVGDSYNADPTSPNYQPVPHPGPNPLDCYGHGSHVAGTAAGYGVTSTGATYNGPYNSSIYSTTTFRIGPGVAPKADLYAIRVFGCEGSTDVVVDALNWAVANRMDVVNMSLGSAYGNPTDPDVEATNNAEDAGIIVVASAGNSGPAPYITGSPGIAEKAISVAAADSIATFPGFNLRLNPGSVGITAMNANDGNPPAKNPLSVYVIPPPAGKTYSGCSESEYVDALIKGKLVVTVRGLCPRVDRAIFGARHGAAAVAMINNSSLNPVYEGPIAGVDIPFLGIQKADGAKLKAATSVLFGAATTLSNSGYTGYASFTSGGPRRGDSMLKPDVTGPGVSILSTLVGSGDKSVRMSGTSMAAPHVAGVAALVRQAHPDWDTADQRAAIVNTPTVSPNKVSDYQVSRGGSGLVQASSAVHTQVTATGEDGATALSFGFNELTHDYKRVMQFQVVNHGNSPATFIASAVKDGSAQPHTVTVSPSSVTVGAGDSTEIKVTLSVKAADVGSAIGSPDDPNNTFWQASGAIRLTPAPGTNSGVSLRVPYFMVPRARSSVETKVSGDFGDSPTATATVTNAKGARSGVADFYAWGLEGSNKKLGEIGIRAVGAQTDPASGTLTFGVNTFGRFDTPNVNEFDILIDTTGTGKPNWVLYAMDLGNAMSGSYDGNYMSILCAIPCKKVKVEGVATAPFNGNTILMPVAISHLGLTAANPRFSYSVMSFDVRGDLGYASDSVAGPAWFNAFTPAITTGQPSYAVAPGATATATVSINSGESDRTPALGLMVVTADNRSGAAQAQLIPIRQNQ